MNTEIFAEQFGDFIASKIDVSNVNTRKEAWGVYFNAMLEEPILLKSMPESEQVVLTMKSVFHNVDWVN